MRPQVETNKIAAAISELADMCAAAAGDMHTAHLNMRGSEFDTLHKKVLKEYYEQFDEDYDSLAERALCYEHFTAPNKNSAAERIGWQSFEGEPERDAAVALASRVIGEVLSQMVTLFTTLNKIDNNANTIGDTNYLQGRIEYWSKELNYFNERRKL